MWRSYFAHCRCASGLTLGYFSGDVTLSPSSSATRTPSRCPGAVFWAPPASTGWPGRCRPSPASCWPTGFPLSWGLGFMGVLALLGRAAVAAVRPRHLAQPRGGRHGRHGGFARHSAQHPRGHRRRHRSRPADGSRGPGAATTPRWCWCHPPPPCLKTNSSACRGGRRGATARGAIHDGQRLARTRAMPPWA